MEDDFLTVLGNNETRNFDSIDMRTMSAIILPGSFSSEFGENTAAFLNFKTTRSLIKFLSPGRRKIASRRPTILAV